MQKIWLISLSLGIGVLVLSFPTMAAFPETGYALTEGYGRPIFAFEMASNTADLIAIFGPEGDPLRRDRIMQMDRGNLWDYPFMVMYSLYLAAFASAMWKETANRIWLVIAGVGFLAGVADAAENLILLDVTRNLDAPQSLEWLAYPVWTKFLSIMVCTCSSCAFILSQSRWIWRMLGSLGVIGGLTIFVAFLSPSQYGYLIEIGTTLGWIAMLVFASIRTFVNR